MFTQTLKRSRPAFAEQYQRPSWQHVHHKLIPNQRDLRDRSHPASQCDVTYRFENQRLKSCVEVGAGFYLLKVTIRSRLELLHRDADDVTAGFVCAAADGFHHAGVSTGANIEAGFDQQAAKLQGLLVFGRLGSAARAAEYRDPLLQTALARIERLAHN